MSLLGQTHALEKSPGAFQRAYFGEYGPRWAGVLAGHFGGVALPAQAQGTLKQKYGDWQHRCDRPNPAGPEQCILIQNVLDQSDLNLAVVILRVEDTAATAEARRRDPSAPSFVGRFSVSLRRSASCCHGALGSRSMIARLVRPGLSAVSKALRCRG